MAGTVKRTATEDVSGCGDTPGSNSGLLSTTMSSFQYHPNLPSIIHEATRASVSIVVCSPASML